MITAIAMCFARSVIQMLEITRGSCQILHMYEAWQKTLRLISYLSVALSEFVGARIWLGRNFQEIFGRAWGDVVAI